MSALVWIGVATLALVVGAVLSTLVQALRDLSRTTLEEIAAIRNQPRASERAQLIMEDVDGHLAAVALPRVVCNLVLVVALVACVAQIRGSLTMSWIEAAIGISIASAIRN